MDFTLYNQISNVAAWLFPKQCMTCKRTLLQSQQCCCDTCYQELPFQHATCHRCGQAFSGLADHCGRCLSSPPPYDACFCPFSYAAPIRDQIIALKYREKPERARDLGTLLARQLLSNISVMPDLILPVPLHQSRLRQRGYNQAQLIAKQVGKMLTIPVNSRLLSKTVQTSNQAELTLKARRNNLQGCFKLNQKVGVESVAILDDVVTTGATVSEIAKILRQKGVDYIQVWGVAHTL